MKEKSEIVVISIKYKNTFDDLINSLNRNSLNWLDSLNWPNSSNQLDFPNWPDFSHQPRLIDKRLHNAPRSSSGITTLLENEYLDEDVLVMLLKPLLKIQTSQMYQYHNVIPLGPKSGRTQLRTVQNMERIGGVSGIEKIKRVKGVEKTIKEIR